VEIVALCAESQRSLERISRSCMGSAEGFHQFAKQSWNTLRMHQQCRLAGIGLMCIAGNGVVSIKNDPCNNLLDVFAQITLRTIAP
jgi:hypothetical protein